MLENNKLREEICQLKRQLSEHQSQISVLQQQTSLLMGSFVIDNKLALRAMLDDVRKKGIDTNPDDIQTFFSRCNTFKRSLHSAHVYSPNRIKIALEYFQGSEKSVLKKIFHLTYDLRDDDDDNFDL